MKSKKRFAADSRHALVLAALFALGAVCTVTSFRADAGVGAKYRQATPAKPKPDARFGNVLFKTPDAKTWKRSQEGGRLVFSAPVPPPDFVTVTVFPGAKAGGDFKRQFEAAVQAELKREGVVKIVSDGGVQESKALEGFPVLQRTIVCETKDFHTVHWFLAGNPGDRFDMIAFQTSGEETYKLYGRDATAFFSSVKLANSLAPGFRAGGQPPAAKPAPQNRPAAVAGGAPRLGRYTIYAYGAPPNRLFLGYLELRSNGVYRVSLPGGKPAGSGTYSYDAGTRTVRWLTGPNRDYGPTAAFTVERGGKTHQLRLKSNTVATNSTDNP